MAVLIENSHMTHRYSMLFVTSILMICSVWFAATANAQGENNIWTFGYHNGLDFNVSPPVFIQTNTEATEGSGSVSDANGNLLFYTNCDKVWDRNGNVMPNGSGLFGNDFGSTSQAAVIARFPADTNKYYLFCLGSAQTIHNGMLFYNVIDMSLNNGLGDVVPASKNILLDTLLNEEMTITKGKCNSYWLISHKQNAPVYRSFKIDAAGIHAPVSSTGLGTWVERSGGEIKVSNDGHKIICGEFSLNGKGFELGLFDPATGIISGTIEIDDFPPYAGYYGLSFSPDGSKVYAAGISVELSQFDISAYPNAAAINATEYIYQAGGMGGTMRIGPDNKIYIARANTLYIGCINNPNATGSVANLDEQALHQPNWALYPPNYDYVGMGLGNIAITLSGDGKDTTIHAAQNITFCEGDSTTLSPGSGYDSYTWNNGSTTASRTIASSGTYWVYSYKECSVTIDSFKVAEQKPSFNILEPDTTICNNVTITLHAQLEPSGTYAWNTGASNAAIEVNKSGVYIASGTNACGSFTDSVKVTTVSCDCMVLVPNAFSPNGDGINDLFEPGIACQMKTFSLSIFNRYGERVFKTASLKSLWDGTFKGKLCDAGTYFYYVSYTNIRDIKIEKKGDVVLFR
jgi:gliding motility-associated-like protein